MFFGFTRTGRDVTDLKSGSGRFTYFVAVHKILNPDYAGVDVCRTNWSQRYRQLISHWRLLYQPLILGRKLKLIIGDRCCFRQHYLSF